MVHQEYIQLRAYGCSNELSVLISWRFRRGGHPLVSESHSSIAALLFPLFNLFAKESEAQRAGRLIKTDMLALSLIALHKLM